MKIEKYRKDRDILSKTVNQIQQDLDLEITEVELGEQTENSYQRIFNWLKNCVDFLIERDPNHFFSLLYRVDVDEQKVKAIIQQQKGAIVAEELSKLILERECLKVISRHIYSQGGDITSLRG